MEVADPLTPTIIAIHAISCTSESYIINASKSYCLKLMKKIQSNITYLVRKTSLPQSNFTGLINKPGRMLAANQCA